MITYQIYYILSSTIKATNRSDGNNHSDAASGAGVGAGAETPGELMEDLRKNLFRSPIFTKYLQMYVIKTFDININYQR